MPPLIVRAYWQATALLLATHLAGWEPAMPGLLVLNLIQARHFLSVRGHWLPLDVQVRWLFLALLMLGLLPGMGLLHVLQLVGLSALLVTDYCLAARLLMLLPWNRPGVSFSLDLVRWALLSPPGPGSIAERLQAGRAGS